MKKHNFSKKLISLTLSALTAFSAGSAAITTAFYSAPAVYAAGGLSSQDSKLLKAEEKMIMGMAKTVFKDIPFFGVFLDGIDSILDLTGAFGSSGSGGKSVSIEDLEELRNHLDEELTEIKSEISRLGADLTSEIGMSFYAGNLGQELIDLHTTSSLNASNIKRYKNSSDYKTENDKLVMVASLIGNTNDWSNNKQNLVYRMHQIGLLLKGTIYSDLDGKSIYQKVYDYYARKSLFSGEIYDKAVPYIDSVVYEYLYAYSVLMECMEASLKVSRFTPEDEAALSAKVSEEYKKLKSNSESVIEDEIGTEALMMFNFHDEKSLVSQYSNFIYNSENNRFTYLNKGTTKIAVKSALSSYEPGSESTIGEFKYVKTNGSTGTEAHNAYKREKDRIGSVPDRYNVISTKNINAMGSYVSSNYSGTSSVWSFLKDRGFSIPTSDSRTNLLLADSKLYDDGALSADGSGYGEYTKTYYLKYKAFNSGLSPEEICMYALVDKKERDRWAYQAITYNHFYRTYIPSPVDSKPASFVYFTKEDPLQNVSEFTYDAKTNSVLVTAKATGAIGRQTVRVQYRENDDDSWTTSYAPTTAIPINGGGTFEVRTIISDEGGQKETTDTQYFSKAKYVEGKDPYIDSDGDYKLGVREHYEIGGRNYAVNDNGSVGEELKEVLWSTFTFRRSGSFYQLEQYTGSANSFTELVIPKTYEGLRITTIGCFGDPFISSSVYKSQFVLRLNENITEIGKNAFKNSQVTKVTGDTSSLRTIGEAAFSGVNKAGGGTLDFRFDYPGEVTVSQNAFYNEDVTARVKHATRLSGAGGANSIKYVFTDDHAYGGEPTWKWSDDYKSAQAFFTCTDERCKHYGPVDATVTTYSEGAKLVYKATVVAGGKTYTTTYTVDHTHTYGEPKWTWSDDHTSATATFTCTDERCRHTETVQATVAKDEKNEKTTYTATAVFDGKTYTDTYMEDHIHTYGDPVWTWADDYSSAKATFTCTAPICKHQETVDAAITKTIVNDIITYTATVKYEGRTYSDTKTSAPLLVPATEPYIDENGAYILGTIEHFNIDGKHYAVNKDGSPGKEITDISLSYFEFYDYDDNSLGIKSFTGSYDSLPDGELIIPKTFNGKPIVAIGTIKTYTRVMAGAKGKEKPFTVVLNKNITLISKYAFYLFMVTNVTGDTSGLREIGALAFSRVKANDHSVEIQLDYPGSVQIGSDAFDGSNVTVCIKHATKLSCEGKAKSIKYDFSDNHLYGDPTWTWSDDHTSATAAFICTDERCKHTETVQATVTQTVENDKIIYTAIAVADSKAYTATYTEIQTHTYGEPAWTWSDDHSTAKATFTCTDCDYQEIVDAEVTKTEDAEKITYTATVEFGGKIYTDIFEHSHTYGEPTWNWSDDHSSAKATFTCTDCDYQEIVDAEVAKTEDAEKITYTATVEFGGKTYTDTYTEEKEVTYVYYPAAEPYIDDEGAYILGYKEHYRYNGKYYFVNSDKSVGEETDNIWISYFKFVLLPNDTYAIEYYTGATKNLTEIVIPKTFNGKKITVLGTDNLDVFIKAGKPQFELVLNENITEIKSCAFNKIGVTKVSGDTSGLCKIGEYAFSWVNKTGGYALDITFAYPGVITTGDAIFNHVNATLRLGHGTTFSNTDFRAASVKYIFDDAHTYGEPTWTWDEDYYFATATFTCTNPGCGHQETIRSKTVETQQPDGQILRSEAVTFNGKEYIAPKPVYRTEVGEYIVEVTGFFRRFVGGPKESIEGTNKLTVRFMDKNGNEVTAPQYIWTAKETAAEGIVLESNGDIMFTKGGDFHVQLTSPDGETVYSSWIPVRCSINGGDDSEKSTPDIVVPDPDNTPKTGDSTSAAAATAILLTSLTAALLLAMKRRKDEEA